MVAPLIVAGIALAAAGTGAATVAATSDKEQEAKNHVENIMKNSMIMVNKNMTRSKVTGVVENIVDHQGCTFYDEVKILQDAGYTADAKAFAEVLNSDKLDQDYAMQAQQTAEAITQTFSLNAGDNIAENITKQVQDIYTEIKNINKTECISVAHSKNANYCGSGSTYYGTFFLGQKTTMRILAECYSKNQNLKDAKQKLLQTIEQTAKAEEKGLFDGMMGIIILAVVLVLGGGTKALTNPMFLLLIAGGVYLYFECTQFDMWCHKVTGSSKEAEE